MEEEEEEPHFSPLEPLSLPLGRASLQAKASADNQVSHRTHSADSTIFLLPRLLT
jgi:hypothetical protein